MRYAVMEAVIRLLPVFISGFLCNLIVGFTAAYIPLVWLLGALFSHLHKFLHSLDIEHTGAGAAATTISCLLFAIIVPSTTYWSYAFMASVTSTMGTLVVVTTATLFNAKFALPHEQSIFGALLNTMTHVRSLHSPKVFTVTRVYDAAARYRCRYYCIISGLQ
jgi:hypothetical protein